MSGNLRRRAEGACVSGTVVVAKVWKPRPGGQEGCEDGGGQPGRPVTAEPAPEAASRGTEDMARGRLA